MPAWGKFNVIALLIFCSSATLCFPAWSQAKYSSKASLAEKIYLQLDNVVYTNDQTIWFKAIVTNASDHSSTTRSGVLYAELVNQDEHIIERKVVEIKQGIANGSFQLDQGYAPGVYLIRAYTEWDKNFGADFFSTQYIKIFSADAKYRADPISSITLVEGTRESRLQVRFNSFAIDSSRGKEIALVLAFDKKNDTLSIKRNQSSDYMLDYPIPAKSRLVSIQIQNNRNFSYSKTVLLDTNYLDFQLLPESGELVQGLPATLGFKALDASGRGQQVKGEIVNGKGAVIALLETNQLGMGCVRLNNIDSAENYKARLLTTKGEVFKEYSFPVIAARGNILSVHKDGDAIVLKAVSNYLISDSVMIRAFCRGVVYYDFKGRLKNGSLMFSLPANSLPEGIIAFTLIVDATKPVASRLYFNERPESRLRIEVKTDKQNYVQREQTNVVIDTKDSEGRPVAVNTSLLVMNKSQVGKMLDHRQTILSYFLMSSDLRGEIEDPGFYFDGKGDRHKDIDALLLTQGWQKYLYAKDSVNLSFKPERELSVSGLVKGGLFSQTDKKEVNLTMMTFGNPPSLQVQKSDSAGRFNFILGEEYGQNLNILIQTTDKRGKQRPYSILLDKKQIPQVAFNHFLAIERPDSIVQAYVNKNVERKKAEDAFTVATDGHIMKEVVIKTYFMSAEKKAITEKYGKPTTIIDGQAIRDKEARWSYGLYSVLMFNFPDKLSIVRTAGGFLYARHYNKEVTLVVIDGIPVRPEEYVFIPDIPPSEVMSFEIIEYAKNFSALYCEVFPRGCQYAPPTGNVIAIYTYGGKGIFGVHPTVGITKASVPVFSVSREFYSPKYPTLKQEDWLKPDLRTLVYWQPVIYTDSLGRASASFYNADLTGTMQIVVEAISENGEIGYNEIFFDVGGKK